MTESHIRLVAKFGDTEYEILAGVMLEGDHLIYEDKFGRKWKLVPIVNEDIKFPFIVIPLTNDTTKVSKST